MKSAFLISVGALLLTQFSLAQTVTPQSVQEQTRYLLRSLQTYGERMTPSQLQRLSLTLDQAQDIIDGQDHRPPPYPVPVPGPGSSRKTMKLNETILGALGTREVAQRSYEEACSAFKREYYELGRDIRLQTITCGTIQEVGGSANYRYKSTATVELEVPQKTVEFKVTLLGKLGTSADAMASFKAACAKLKADSRHDAGSRYITVMCGNAADIGGSANYQYKSTATVHLISYGDVRAATDTVNGFSGNKEQATESWNRKCDEWREEVRARYRGRLVFANCGEPRDIGGSSNYQFTSTATVHFEP